MEMEMDSIAGKVALVTGSSRGIGAAIARAFAKRGALVVVHGRDDSAISAVRHDIESSGGRAISVRGELTEASQLEQMRRRIDDEAGSVDILVTNAGGTIPPPGPFEQVSEDTWRKSIDDNLLSTFLTLKCFVPSMKSRCSGTIITMSSAAARRPHAQSPIAYAVAKAGIQMLTQDLAVQLGPYGIRVNCLAPETILTERNQQRIPEHVQKSLIEEHPLRRLGSPEDVADAAVFLASAESSWISGVTLDIAGGAVVR
jgi:3-oxoacyl-[acyl-carrier protein] reductase